jgi:hypothetical protein
MERKHQSRTDMDYQDNQRYIEYFQRQLVREGSDSFLRDHQLWLEKNRTVFAERFRQIGIGHEEPASGLADSVLSHRNQGDYDSFFARQIFQPLVRKALDICNEGGFPLKNPVKFVNSPGLEPSPAALPSSIEHLLFMGQGTFAFCNYWCKIFSSAMAEVSKLSSEERKSTEAIFNKLKSSQALLDATRLSVHYANFNSVLGFGRIEHPKNLVTIRALLVNSMEIFVVGHEIGHLLAHESHPETHGIPEGTCLKEHELECDAVGLAISTAYGVREENGFAFQLIGALLFFYALHTCDQVKGILVGHLPKSSESHPSHEERFRFTLDFLRLIEANDTTMESVRFALDVAECLGSQVQLIAHNLKEKLAD